MQLDLKKLLNLKTIEEYSGVEYVIGTRTSTFCAPVAEYDYTMVMKNKDIIEGYCTLDELKALQELV